jgi:hypothetical protein
MQQVKTLQLGMAPPKVQRAIDERWGGLDPDINAGDDKTDKFKWRA